MAPAIAPRAQVRRAVSEVEQALVSLDSARARVGDARTAAEADAGIVAREVRKVVWPTRKETTQMTLYVFGFVVLMALFLWLTDKTLEWVLYDLILGWKK